MGSLRSDRFPFFTRFPSTPQWLPLGSLCSFSTWRLVSVFSFRKCSRRIIPLSALFPELWTVGCWISQTDPFHFSPFLLVFRLSFGSLFWDLRYSWFLASLLVICLTVRRSPSFVVFLQRALFPFPGCPVPPNPLKIPPTDEFSDPTAPLSWISSVSEWRFPCSTPKVFGLSLSTAGFLPLCSNIWLYLKVKARKQLGEFHYFV